MTIETIRKCQEDKADYLITCDEKECRSALDATDRTFHQAITFLKAKGWRVRKVYSSWFHTCPNHGIGL